MYSIRRIKRSLSSPRTKVVCLGFTAWIATAIIFTSCNRSKIHTNIPQETITNSLGQEEIESSNEKIEGEVVNREFVEVALIADDHFILENTKGAFYWLDIKYNEDYSVGDFLCLVYKDKEKVTEDCWKVVPIQLYVNDNRVDLPQY